MTLLHKHAALLNLSKFLSESWFVEELLFYSLFQCSHLHYIMSKQIWSVKQREGREFHTINYLLLASVDTEILLTQCNY